MTNFAPSDKVAELYKTFRDSENEVEQLKQTLRQKMQSTEKTQRDLGAVNERVSQLEAEQRASRKNLVKAKEQNAVFEAQLSKEKDHQYTIYVELIQLEEQKRHLEEKRTAQQLELTRQLKQQAAEYSSQRQTAADCVRQGIKKIAQGFSDNYGNE